MNQLIIDLFTKLLKKIKKELSQSLKEGDQDNAKKHGFRAKRIAMVINSLKKIKYEITDSKQLKGVSGIGSGTIQRINEILETGKLSELENEDEEEEYNELEEVIGIGPKLAKKIFDTHGIKTVKQLKNAHRKGKIILNDKILLGLKYHGVIKENIPRNEMDEINEYLKKEIKNMDKKLDVIICGSYRRGRLTSNDIDIIITHKDIITQDDMESNDSYLELVVKKLKKKKFLIDDITDKNYFKKYMGFCRLKDHDVRRIDMRFMPLESYATAILYFTGPYELNTDMRNRAIKLKMILNEYGLFKKSNGKKILTKTEKDVFEKLGMEYLTPEERENYNAHQ